MLAGFFLFHPQHMYAFSYEWTTSEDFLSEAQKKELKKKYPTLHNAEEIQSLLQEVSAKNILRNLSIGLYNGKLLLVGKIGKRINKIEVQSTIRDIHLLSFSIGKKFSKEMDSEKIRQQIKTQISQSLKQKGYPHPTVKIDTKSDRQSVNYLISIEEGAPCRIQEFSLPEETRKRFKWKWQKGDICDIDSLQEKIAERKEELHADGFSQATLDIDRIEYSKDEYSAHVYLDGYLGTQHRYVIREENSNVILDFLHIQPIKVEALSQDFTSVESDIIRYYKEKGYSEVQINETIQEKKGEWSILTTFVVKKGIRYTISSVDFQGNKNFPSDMLLEKINVSSFLHTRPALHEGEIDRLKNNLRNFYQESGYWDVNIKEPRIGKEKTTGKAHLSFFVEEGLRYQVGKIFLSGNQNIQETDILSKLSIQPGSIIPKSSIVKSKEIISTLYLNQGYLYIDVKEFLSVQSTPTEVEVFITLHIQEGPQVHFGKISIQGLEKTVEKVVKRKLLFATGDVFSQEQIARSRSALMSLGIFNTIQIIPNIQQQSKKSPVIDVDIQLIEGNAGTFSFGPGYNLYSGFAYTGETAYNNLWGTGRRISLRGGISEEKHQQDINDTKSSKGDTLLGRKVGIGYLEPNLADGPLDLLLSVSHSGTADDIWQLSYIFESSLRYPIEMLPFSWVDLFYRLHYEKDKGSQLQEDQLVLTGNTRVAAIGLRFHTDTRDNKGWPTSGVFLASEVQLSHYALYSQYQFERYNFQSSHYLPLFSDLVLAYGMDMTLYQNINRSGDDPNILPSGNRLQPGGADRVRGFARPLGAFVQTPGTENSTNILGGSQSVVLKTEMRYQVKPNSWGLALFLDVGNSFFTEKELRDFQKFYDNQPIDEKTNQKKIPPSIGDNYRYNVSSLSKNPKELYTKNFASSGVALKVLTPLGALNVAIAWPIHEPSSVGCQESGACLSRASKSTRWYKKYQLELNIGAEF